MDKEYEYAPSSERSQANRADLLDAQTADEDVDREDDEDSKGPQHIQIGAVFDHAGTLSRNRWTYILACSYPQA
jgi:hypothetical protein